MILITSATGKVGAEVTNALMAQDRPVRIASRDVARAQALADEHSWRVDAVAMDFDDEASIRAVLNDVDRVFLATPHGDPERVLRFVDIAEDMWVDHVVRLSGISAGFGEETAHRLAERAIEESGLRHTFLRPNFFMQNFTTWYADDVRDGAIRLPAGEGRVAYIDVRDIAAVAAAALTTREHDGETYTLTGPDALTHGEVAQIFSEVLGREIGYDALAEDEADAGAWRLYGMVRDGSSSAVTDDVERALGRQPTELADFVRDYAGAWA